MNKKFENYISYSYENALELFKETEEYHLLDEGCRKSERELQKKYSEADFDFIARKMDAYIMRAEHEGEFLYRQAFKDCVDILKELGVIK